MYCGDAFYVAQVENDLIGEYLTCGSDDFGVPAFSTDGGSIAWPARDGIFLQDVDDYSLEKVATFGMSPNAQLRLRWTLSGVRNSPALQAVCRGACSAQPLARGLIVRNVDLVQRAANR